MSHDGSQFSGSNTSGTSTQSVPLEQLTAVQGEQIECPVCGQHAQTTIKARTDKTYKFMDIFWWPFPNRKHWWEETKWFCNNCQNQLAAQKHGKNLNVLV